MTNPDATMNGLIDARVAEIFPAVCIEECALLQGAVSRFKDFSAINREKGGTSTDVYVRAMATARLDAERETFASQLSGLAEGCVILNNQSKQEIGE